jgi:hypothetical protein
MAPVRTCRAGMKRTLWKTINTPDSIFLIIIGLVIFLLDSGVARHIIKSKPRAMRIDVPKRENTIILVREIFVLMKVVNSSSI